MSQLKRKVRPLHRVGIDLLVPGSSPVLEPVAILAKRMVKRGNQAAT